MRTLSLFFLMVVAGFSQTIDCFKFELRQEGIQDIVDYGVVKNDRPFSVYVHLENTKRAAVLTYINVLDVQRNTLGIITTSWRPKPIKAGWNKLFEVNSNNSPLVMTEGEYTFAWSLVVDVNPWVCKIPSHITVKVK